MAHEDEIEWLSGGNTHGPIAKIGPTVRRPTGPWTAGVHALLLHLEHARFRAAPRALGFDDEGREILTFIDGVVVWPDNFHLVEADDALGEVAAVIRAYHDAVSRFDPGGHSWSDLAADPSGVCETLCHNDLAPWNLIRTAGGWAFIDWDLAAPGRRSWDLSWAMMGLIPFFPGRQADPGRLRQRIEVFCAAYGRAQVPLDVVAVARERAEHEAATIRSRGARGHGEYARLLEEGHAHAWEETAAHIGAHEGEWADTVRAAVARAEDADAAEP